MLTLYFTLVGRFIILICILYTVMFHTAACCRFCTRCISSMWTVSSKPIMIRTVWSWVVASRLPRHKWNVMLSDTEIPSDNSDISTTAQQLLGWLTMVQLKISKSKTATCNLWKHHTMNKNIYTKRSATGFKTRLTVDCWAHILHYVSHLIISHSAFIKSYKYINAVNEHLLKCTTCFHLRHCSSAASAVCQLLPAAHTATSIFNTQMSGLCGWPNSLELIASLYKICNIPLTVSVTT